MKTTLNIPDPLYAELKDRAAREGRTVTNLVEQAIRHALEAEPSCEAAPLLPTWHGGSDRGYLVDITDRDALWGALDGSA